MAIRFVNLNHWLPQSLVWRVFSLYAATLLLFVSTGFGVFYRHKMTETFEQAQQSALMLTEVAAQTVTESVVIGDYDTIERLLGKLITHSPFSSAAFIEVGGSKLVAVKPHDGRLDTPDWLLDLVSSHLSDVNQIIKEGGRDYGVLRLKFDVREIAYEFWYQILEVLLLGTGALVGGMALIWWPLRSWLGKLDRVLLAGQSATPERMPDVESLIGDMPLEFRPLISALNQATGHLHQELEVRERALDSLRDVISSLQEESPEGEAGVAGQADLVQMSSKVSQLVSRWLVSREAGEYDSHAAETAKSEFLANMSHEIRTPINGVMGYLQLMSRESLDEKSRGYVSESLNATRLLLRVLNDVLDFSKIEAGELDIHTGLSDLHTMLGEVHGLMQAQLGGRALELRLDIDPQLPRFALTDDMRLRQVLLNLTSNAIKFTEHGAVMLCVRAQPLQDEQFRLEVQVQDTGIGIGAQQLSHLFQAFHQADGSRTRRFGGSGLGLVISQRLLKLMGSEGLRVQSVEGQGSVFSFELVLKVPRPEELPSSPVEVGAAERAGGAAGSGGEPLLGRSILLVEDNPTNIDVALNMLESLGAEVTIAINGQDALDVLHELGPCFDLVLMDMQMPEMDGLEATRRIKADPDLARLPIVAMTANTMEQDRRACLEAGMVDHLGKPFELADLVRAIDRYAIH